jgi:signal transduction histidine kinase/ActR/RegA family two-component response regulator
VLRNVRNWLSGAGTRSAGGAAPRVAPRPDPALVAYLSTTDVPLALVDRELRLLAWNPPFVELARADLAGEPAERLQGTSILDLLSGEGREWVGRQLRSEQGARAGAQFGRVRFGLQPGAELLLTGSRYLERGVHAGWYLRFNPDPDFAFADPSVHELTARVRGEKERLAALLTVSHAVVHSLDLDIILGTIAQQVRQVIEVDGCTVFLIDETGQVLVPAVCDALRFRDEMMAMRLRVGEGITGSVALTGRGEIVRSAEDDPRAAHVPGTPPEESSLMCVPMITRERVVGVITLARLGARSFEQADLELATLFAAQCSAALANARIYDELKRAYDELRATQVQLVQSEKLNALGQMAAGVAHDFNNILAAILGRTQLMIREARDPGLSRQLLVVQQAARDGAQVVRRVQEFTRIRHDEPFTALDLNAALLDVIELTRMAWEMDAKQRGVTIRVHPELEAQQSISGNASELREVLTNLILNAADAMPEGGDLFVGSADAGAEVVIRVRDTGIGMDPETRARVFEPFFTTKSGKGTGLGLSVAYGIVTRHRGTIEVRSEPGHGAEFTLRFPACAAPAAAAPAAGPEGPVGSFRVLVIDDEEPVAGVLAEALRGLGQQVTEAIGGREGIAQLERVRPQVVFTDLGMPEVNGWDLARAAKAQSGDTRVVLVTGWSSQIEPGATRARGVDFVLPKPFSLEDVERVLREAVEAMEERPAA